MRKHLQYPEKVGDQRQADDYVIKSRVIIIKTKVLLLQSLVDFGYPI